MSADGRVSLSAIDFLGLAEQRKVARIDLGELGFEGVIYVRDLTAAEYSRITSGGRSGKARFYSDKSYEMDLATLTQEAGPRFLMAAVVTDAKGGEILERAFAADTDAPDAKAPDAKASYITIAASELVQMSDEWIRSAGNRSKAEEKLGQMPHIVTNEVVKMVKLLSGLADEDAIEEKKGSS